MAFDKRDFTVFGVAEADEAGELCDPNDFFTSDSRPLDSSYIEEVSIPQWVEPCFSDMKEYVHANGLTLLEELTLADLVNIFGRKI
jgi:hypothetical protein